MQVKIGKCDSDWCFYVIFLQTILYATKKTKETWKNEKIKSVLILQRRVSKTVPIA